MHFARILGIVSLLTFGCGSEAEESYATLQDCFDDHTKVEGLGVEEAIVVCTLDHDIGGERLEFADLGACIAYVDANLDAESATAAQIDAACFDYLEQQGM